MEEKTTNNTEYIDLRDIIKHLYSKKILFFKVWLITVILAAFYIFPVPRTYNAQLSLAPELGGGTSGGSLSSLASNFGINLSNIQSEDAFYPELYPEVVESNAFITRLFDVKVKSLDGEINTDYYNYLLTKQKVPFYSYPKIWIMKTIKSFSDSSDETEGANAKKSKANPFMLTKKQDAIAQAIRFKIKCDIDIKTNVITISATDQDPLICATICDSVRVLLQEFITKYRTEKCARDVEYYQKLLNEAKIEYDKSVRLYSAYCDANQGTILQAFISERDKMENDMSTKLNTYNALNTQLQATKAKLQERTPSFTILSGASVPIKPTGPKRIIFILAMLVLTTTGTVLFIYRKELIRQFTVNQSKQKQTSASV